ncbi:MAG TPA: GMC family oxidoreductase N-terminal domain-containing protein [Symbiobacteriaceae bacterium]|nr:GMC family oxidoreductase N-terminal domain-containing protein [Symbiobacteriaceae bacterium]
MGREGCVVLSGRQWQTLRAVCETLIPGAGADLPERLVQVLATSGNPKDLVQFRQALMLLGTPGLGWFLHGEGRPFSRLERSEQEAVLRRWACHSLPVLRQAFQAFKRLTGFLWASAQGSPMWSGVGYPGADRRRAGQPLLQVSPPPPDRDDVEADAIVVGSGAGGGVAAATLAARGLRVVVLEKGGFFPEGELGLGEARGMEELYLDRGMTSTGDLSMTVLAGSAVGGGTLINWTACIAPPDWLRQEWEQEYGLTGLTSPAFSACVDEVCARLGVHSGESASLPNSSAGRLLAGCRALGYHADDLPRNVAGCGEDCGFCAYGCRTGAKQSTARTFLVDAVEQGAQVVPRADVRRVLMQGGAVTGVEAAVGGRTVRFRAPRVVLAGGAIGTPALLLRSGLSNPQIGRNLHLHPVVGVLGGYEEPIRPWSGRLLPAYSRQFARLDGNYGFLLEVAPAHPGLGGMSFPWRSGQQFLHELGQMDRTGVFIVLVRDRDAGRVTVDRAGRHRIDYVVSEYDRRHLLQGQREALRVHRAAGARRLMTLHAGYNVLEGGSDEAAADFAERSQQLPSGPNQLPIFSAHQMGTCRMGASPETAVAGPDGQVFGVRGLYVADGSAFPAASGVNPMITIMSLAAWVAKQVK